MNEAEKKYNKEVDKKVKELMNAGADELFKMLRTQHLYRYGGIEYNSFKDILREIAEAKVCGVSLIESGIRSDYINKEGMYEE